MREEALGIERLSSLEHEVHRTGEPCGDDRQALALAVLGHQPGTQRLGATIPSQEAHCGFRERPLQVRVADLATRVPEDLARRFLGRLHQPVIGQEILHPREALDSLDLIDDR